MYVDDSSKDLTALTAAPQASRCSKRDLTRPACRSSTTPNRFGQTGHHIFGACSYGLGDAIAFICEIKQPIMDLAAPPVAQAQPAGGVTENGVDPAVAARSEAATGMRKSYYPKLRPHSFACCEFASSLNTTQWTPPGACLAAAKRQPLLWRERRKSILRHADFESIAVTFADRSQLCPTVRAVAPRVGF